MLNILIPSCGKSEFFSDSYYPKNVIEINGKPMIQHVIENYSDIPDKKFTFIILQDECNRFHTDHVVSILTKKDANIITLKNPTGGALCTCLMAVEYINSDDELIIANNDQVICEDISCIIEGFRKCALDCALICFDSVHPRWSYARLEGENVVETAEKRPLSRHAIAGFYYFKRGRDFVMGAKRSIRKGETYEGNYYISAAINEMILMNKKVGYTSIDNTSYFSFYSPEKINTFIKYSGDMPETF